MFTDFLNFLKFITDSQTRDTVKAFAEVASRKQKDWKQYVRSVSGKFTVAEWAKINAFTNDLFQKVLESGLSESKFRRFKTAYSELVDNAYHHGCKKRSNCKVTIKCVFSKWFIQLEITDTGKGFNYEEALDNVHQERWEEKRSGKSGLEVVSDVVDSLHIHKSRILIVIACDDRIKVHKSTERISRKELLTIIVEADKDWSFLSPDWTPLREALDEANQELVLVRFGTSVDTHNVPFATKKKFHMVTIDKDDDDLLRPTRPRREAKIVISEAMDENRYYAYVVPTHWVHSDMKELQTDNLKFFQTELDAKNWLRKCAKQL